MTPLPLGAPVFVTGATGMIGSHVAEQLRERGHPVRALHRPGADTSFLRALGCELVAGDLATSVVDAADALNAVDALGESMAGCAAVVHAAAVAYTKLPWPEVRRINVGGMERVLRAAARVGARRVVHFSSVAVHGDPWHSPDEASPLDGPLAPRELYARSKREAEVRGRALTRELGLDVVILRPAAIYGERDRLFTPKLLEVFRFPIQPVLGSGRIPIPAVYAGNVADAALAVLGAADGASARRSPTRARVYELGVDHPVTPLELYEALARALGVPFRPIHIPAPLVRVGARVGEALGIRIDGAEELPLARTARLSLGPNPFGSVRIRSELGWAPRFSLEQALERTAAWVARERAALGFGRASARGARGPD